MYQMLSLIISYAKDDDVRQMLMNCKNEIDVERDIFELAKINNVKVSKKELTKLINKKIEINTKIFLTYLLMQNSVPNEYNPFIKYTYAVTRHLNAIAACYFSYFLLISSEDNKNKVNVPNVHLTFTKNGLYVNEYVINLNKMFNAHGIRKEEFAEIFHEIIDNYTKHKFYYEFSNEEVNKIEFEYDAEFSMYSYVLTPFKLVNQDRNPHILNEETGLTFSIGRQLKGRLIEKDNIIYPTPNTFDNFISIHKRLIKALNYNFQRCHWCNPDKEIKKGEEKIKCPDCRNLLEYLNELKSWSSDKDICKISFNEAINVINYNNLKNLAEVRTERKKYLMKFLKSLQNIQDEELLKNTETLINKVFTTNYTQ